MSVDETLNELLVRMFKDLMEIEERCLITEDYKDISNNDMHIIEAVGVDESKSMSAIAKLMSVTTGTLTKAMDALAEKGYVVRSRSKTDKRVVEVSLTERGQKAYRHHEQFHQNMIEHIKNGMSDQETSVLIYTLAKLVDYFQELYNSQSEEVKL